VGSNPIPGAAGNLTSLSGGMLIHGMGAKRSPPDGGDLFDGAAISW
jgi:hypothetical protein